MQAQLSELQKMFCQLSESVNVNKNRVEPYTGVSSSDSKLTNPKPATLKLVIKNAPADEIASINN